MSYDVMVFDPASAPTEREAFIAWYEASTEWQADKDYDDLTAATPGMAAWFHDMIRTFPAMTGPFAGPDDTDDADWGEYSITPLLIYATFASSKTDEVYRLAIRLAEKHSLGFYDCSDSCDVWLPDGEGGMAIAMEAVIHKPDSFLGKLFKGFSGKPKT